MCVCALNSSGTGQIPVVGFYEHGTVTLHSVKAGNFADHLSDYKILMKETGVVYFRIHENSRRNENCKMFDVCNLCLVVPNSMYHKRAVRVLKPFMCFSHSSRKILQLFVPYAVCIFSHVGNFKMDLSLMEAPDLEGRIICSKDRTD